MQLTSQNDSDIGEGLNPVVQLTPGISPYNMSISSNSRERKST